MRVTNKLASSPLKLMLKFLSLQNSKSPLFVMKLFCPFLFFLLSPQGLASWLNLKQTNKKKKGKQNCSCIVILKLHRHNSWELSLFISTLGIWALLNMLQIYPETSSSFLWADFLAWEIIRHVCMNINKLVALLISLAYFSHFKYL